DRQRSDGWNLDAGRFAAIRLDPARDPSRSRSESGPAAAPGGVRRMGGVVRDRAQSASDRAARWRTYRLRLARTAERISRMVHDCRARGARLLLPGMVVPARDSPAHAGATSADDRRARAAGPQAGRARHLRARVFRRQLHPDSDSAPMTSTQARGPLRVAQIIHGAGVGGTERHIRSLLERLPEHGITPILIASEEGTLLEFARSRGIETHVAPRTSAWSYLRALRRLLETMRPDIAHAHSGRLPCIAARLARIPRIVETRHGALIGLGPVRQWPAIGLVEGWKCRMAHQTITVCASDRRWLITRGGLDPSRVLSILNGISVDHGDTSLSRPDASQTQDRMRALGRGSRSTPNGS